jgi:cell division protein FtsA
MIVEARLEEIFELVNNELRSIGRASKLPGGLVLTGGGANLKGVDHYAKHALQLPARVINMRDYNGMTDNLSDPGYSTALGLMLIDLLASNASHKSSGGSGTSGVFDALQGFSGKFGGLLRRFKP